MEKKQTYGFEIISVKELEKIIKQERAFLIDIREEEQYRKGHIRNARNYPFEYIADWKNDIPDRVSLILYCEKGNQSLLAARKMRERKGAVYTLRGGYQAFINEMGERGNNS